MRSIAGIAVGMTLMGGVAFVAWSLLWPVEADVRIINGRLVGETTGWVARVDHKAGLLQVSRAFVGFSRQEFIIGPDATILIRDKEGGVEDLNAGMPVRVAWAKAGDTRRALSIQLVESSASALPAPHAAGTARDEIRRSDLAPAPPPVAPDSEPGVPPVERPAPVPRAIPDSTGGTPTLDPNLSNQITPKAQRRSVARTPSTESVVPQTSPRSSDARRMDGSDAIDWLIKESGRR